MANNHFHFDLGNMPPVAWVIILVLLSMLVGKLADVSILFNLGVVGLGLMVVVAIFALLYDVFS